MIDEMMNFRTLLEKSSHAGDQAAVARAAAGVHHGVDGAYRMR